MLDEYLAKIDVIRDTPNVDKLCHLHSFNKADELFLAIGMEKIVLGPVDEAYLKGKNNSGGWRRLLSFGRKKKDEQEETTRETSRLTVMTPSRSCSSCRTGAWTPMATST